MAEAILSRYGAGSTSEDIPPIYCKFVLYLKTSTNKPISNMNVHATFDDKEYDYFTKEDGSITMYPFSGWCNINLVGGNTFDNGVIIADQYINNSWYNFEAPLGEKIIQDIKYIGYNESEIINLVGGNYTFRAANTIDINLSGGGGGGGGAGAGEERHWSGTGGSGYTNKINGYQINKNKVYNVSIGGGGYKGTMWSNWIGGTGGTSYFDDISANGGTGGTGANDWYDGKPGIGGDGAAGGGGACTWQTSAGSAGSGGWCFVTIHY